MSTLTEPDRAQARAAVCAGRQNCQCGAAVVRPLIGSGNLKQQLLPPLLQPVAIGNPWWNTGDDLIQCQIGFQPLATAVNLFKRIDVRARPKGQRLERCGDCLVSEDTKISQHEFGPVLVEITKKYQPKPLAQSSYRQAVNTLPRSLTPREKRL